MTLEEALRGREIPDPIRESLVLIDIPHLSFKGTEEVGQMLLHKELSKEVSELFAELLEQGFPVMKIIPVVFYDWDDEKSMEANNTSAFNYRTIMGTNRLSNHSFGRAIDINPLQNPYVLSDGTVSPKGAIYDPTQGGTMTPTLASIFKKRGWRWGGDWQSPKDWQHFEKSL